MLLDGIIFKNWNFCLLLNVKDWLGWIDGHERFYWREPWKHDAVARKVFRLSYLSPCSAFSSLQRHGMECQTCGDQNWKDAPVIVFVKFDRDWHQLQLFLIGS